MMNYLKFLLIFCAFNVFSQSNFVEGKITTNQNEIINGLINKKAWKVNPDKIEFRKESESFTYLPEDILSFEVQGDKYVSRIINLDVSSQNINNMKEEDQPEFITKKVFLNVLVEGKANLYEYYDTRNHYFIGIDDDFEELINRKYLKKDTETQKKTISVYKKYIGQLKLFLNDCNSIETTNLKYDDIQLQKLFNAYNSCISDGSNYLRKIEKDKIKVSLLAGVSFFKMTFGANYDLLRGLEDQNFTVPVFGLAADFNFKEDRSKWSLYTEFSYKTLKKDVDYIQEFSSISPDIFNQQQLKLKLSNIQVLALIRHKFKSDNTKIIPFLNAGVGLGLDVGSYSKITQIRAVTGQVVEYDNPLYLKSSYYNFPIGIGLIYNNLSIEARYNYSSNISDEDYNNSRLNGLTFLLNYNLL